MGFVAALTFVVRKVAAVPDSKRPTSRAEKIVTEADPVCTPRISEDCKLLLKQAINLFGSAGLSEQAEELRSLGKTWFGSIAFGKQTAQRPSGSAVELDSSVPSDRDCQLVMEATAKAFSDAALTEQREALEAVGKGWFGSLSFGIGQ